MPEEEKHFTTRFLDALLPEFFQGRGTPASILIDPVPNRLIQSQACVAKLLWVEVVLNSVQSCDCAVGYFTDVFRALIEILPLGETECDSRIQPEGIILALKPGVLVLITYKAVDIFLSLDQCNSLLVRQAGYAALCMSKRNRQA